ncbi:hypothetical protein [Pseudohoeflea coraliihabitans]|uniref:Outer membrane lipoprotein n=1 Tax=Pseudohoeflea coraliihabitans TaxID=2860393 RepID=A0ABS6WQC8_9HYPH|nr:hypothetical protein [Pseudohoeflea sp. DP4N28-3]
MNRLHLAGAAALSLTLIGCQAISYAPGYNSGGFNQPRRAGIEGQWVDPNGIVSSFYSGRFETRTTDTNSLLAQGSYTQVSPSLVEIELTSLLRNTTSKVNCAQVSRDRLNCTSSSGSQFTLSRRA